MKAVLYDHGSESVVRRGDYPRHDLAPVSDPTPGHEWLLVVDGALPATNLAQDVQTTEAPGGPHPQHPHLNTWQITRTAVVSPAAAERLRERIAMRRWEEETAGVVANLGGGRTVEVATDAISQAKLTGLLVVAAGQQVAVSWKGADGVFVDITSADVPAMASAVFSHVQTCFAREAALLGQLSQAEDLVAFAATVEAFW